MKELTCVVGMPKTGTTVVTNFFCNKTNSICFIEPIWLRISQKKSNKFKDGFIDNIIKNSKPNEVLKCIYEKSIDYEKCFIKETFKIDEILNIEILLENIKIFKEIIIIKRNNFFTFSAWKRSILNGELWDCYGDVDFFIETLIKFNLFLKKIEKKQIINYENFCEENYMKFYNPILSTFGDKNCKTNNFIKKPNKNISNLSNEEIKKIRKITNKFL